MIEVEKQVPKYVMDLLRRREKLASDLLNVISKLDTYCERIGVDMYSDEIPLGSHVMVFCEPWTVYRVTLSAIKEALNKEERE